MKKIYLITFFLILLLGCTSIQLNNTTVSNVKNITKEAINTTKEIVSAVQNASDRIIPVAKEAINETIIVTKTLTQELVTNRTNLTLEKKYDAIIALGDSLTYGEGLNNKNNSWISLYANNTKLYNYAVSGATTFSARYYQLELFKNQSIQGNKLVFIWIGANDAAMFIPLSDFDDNYRNIVNQIKSMKNTTLVIMNIPDASKLKVAETAESQVDEYLAKYGITINIKVRTVARELLAQYNKIIQNIADENQLKVIDMFNFLDSFDESMITQDQFHPNELGHKLIAEKVREEVR